MTTWPLGPSETEWRHKLTHIFPFGKQRPSWLISERVAQSPSVALMKSIKTAAVLNQMLLKSHIQLHHGWHWGQASHRQAVAEKNQIRALELTAALMTNPSSSTRAKKQIKMQQMLLNRLVSN
jgi:hypothetical protein